MGDEKNKKTAPTDVWRHLKFTSLFTNIIIVFGIWLSFGKSYLIWWLLLLLVMVVAGGAAAVVTVHTNQITIQTFLCFIVFIYYVFMCYVVRLLCSIIMIINSGYRIISWVCFFAATSTSLHAGASSFNALRVCVWTLNAERWIKLTCRKLLHTEWHDACSYLQLFIIYFFDLEYYFFSFNLTHILTVHITTLAMVW